MRPLPTTSDTISGRGRPREPPSPSAAPALTCFITNEADMDASENQLAPSPHLRPTARKHSAESQNQQRSHRPACLSSAAASDSSSSSSSSLSSYMPTVATDQRMPQGHPGQTPESLFAGLSEAASAVSTGSSRRESSATSSIEYQDSYRPSNAPFPLSEPSLQDASISPVPQLIMPSLIVPRRRPFTDTGKSIGKLKVLVAGQSGIGKTSLIQSIAQSCDHIVHMDPTTPPETGHVTETFASTRAQPWWRTDLDSHGHSPRTIERRMSMSEVLDRNLCFVDDSTHPDNSTFALQYVKSQLASVCESPLGEADLCSLLSSGAESIVDAVLYMLPHTGPNTEDLKRLRALQHMTNVVLLLARSDELESEHIANAKRLVRQAMDDEGIASFSFSNQGSSGDVYAVSNVTHPDNDTMDASVLMSSGYFPPLVSTDLSELVEQIFSLDGSSWLRHSAAQKCVRWRRKQGRVGPVQQTALSHRRRMFSGAISPFLTASPFDRSCRQSWGRLEVTDWARGLRQSLEAERLDHMWCRSSTGTNVPLSDPSLAVVKNRGQNRRHQQQRNRSPRSPEIRHPANPHYQDPLGLLGIASQAMCSGKLTVELLSSLGLAGCLAAWLMRPEQTYHHGICWLSR